MIGLRHNVDQTLFSTKRTSILTYQYFNFMWSTLQSSTVVCLKLRTTSTGIKPIITTRLPSSQPKIPHDPKLQFSKNVDFLLLPNLHPNNRPAPKALSTEPHRASNHSLVVCSKRRACPTICHPRRVRSSSVCKIDKNSWDVQNGCRLPLRAHPISSSAARGRPQIARWSCCYLLAWSDGWRFGFVIWFVNGERWIVFMVVKMCGLYLAFAVTFFRPLRYWR